ncbi:hypothetical protein [Burkholderia sp. BE17]|uniref:hypothetical protein n=1 Tax=Burkholderia sp. BE17 TaxID=2656644 RepID=UPI00187B8BC6|nr:hypothetical protein [Burkholderia sp. BE17]
MSDMATDLDADMTLTAMVAESVARCRPVSSMIRHDARLRMKLLYRNGFRYSRV